jgi:hypothetical protein
MWSNEMIAKVKPVQAWMCGYCFKLYPKNEGGKRFAEVCCICSSDGCEEMTSHSGHGNLCKKCALTKTIASNEGYLERTQKQLEADKAQLAKILAAEAERKGK